MKISELNGHQARALRMVKEIYNDIIGGWENTLLDYSEDEDEYQRAYKALHNPEGLVETIYYDVVRGMSDTEIRFAGKEWIKERIARKLLKDGYYPNYIKRPEYDLRKAR